MPAESTPLMPGGPGRDDDELDDPFAARGSGDLRRRHNAEGNGSTEMVPSPLSVSKNEVMFSTLERPQLRMRKSSAAVQGENGIVKADEMVIMESEDLYAEPSRFPLWLRRFVPIFNWLPGYKTRWLVKDLSAGVTLGVMLIPQTIAYALLAGLPPYYGLYGSIIPPLAYAIFGTSKHLHMGPDPVISLLVADNVLNIVGEEEAEADPNRLVEVALLMSLVIGLVYMLMGLLQLGWLTNFLADPVMSGFTTGAAVLIGSSQLKYLFGISLKRGAFFPTIIDLFNKLDETNFWAVTIGTIGLLILVLCKNLNKRYRFKIPIPGELVVVILGILVTYSAELDTRHGVDVVGDVPAGIPGPRMPDVDNLGEDLSNADLLLSSAVTAIIGYISATSIAATFAAKNGYQVDHNQELFALGMSNMIGGMWLAYPNAGSLCRSALLNGLGVHSALHNLIGVALVLLALAALTPLLFYLPKALLASIIFTALWGLLAQVKDAWRFWKLNKSDFMSWLLTFVATVVLETELGLITGVVVSMVILIQRTSRPTVHQLGLLPNSVLWRSKQQYPDAQTLPGTLIVRFDGALHFANKEHFRTSLQELLFKFSDEGDDLRYVVLDSSSIGEMDASSIDMLVRMAQEIHAAGANLLFVAVNTKIRDMMGRGGLFDIVDALHLCPTLEDAVQVTQHAGHGLALDGSLTDWDRPVDHGRGDLNRSFTDSQIPRSKSRIDLESIR